MITRSTPKICKFHESYGCIVKGCLYNTHHMLALNALECSDKVSLWNYLIDLIASEEDIIELQIIDIENLETIEIYYNNFMPMTKHLQDPLIGARAIELTIYVAEGKVIIETCRQLINSFIEHYNLIKLLINVSRQTCFAKLESWTPISIEIAKMIRQLQYKFIVESNTILIIKPLHNHHN